MKRDFWAIMKAGNTFIAQSDNPSEAAAKKLVYGLAQFVPEDEIQSVLLLSRHLDFDTAVAAIAQLGEEEYKWAGQLLFEVCTADGPMNDAQKKLRDRFFEIYYEYKDYNKE